jgi:hypothetical protein
MTARLAKHAWRDVERDDGRALVQRFQLAVSAARARTEIDDDVRART